MALTKSSVKMTRSLDQVMSKIKLRARFQKYASSEVNINCIVNFLNERKKAYQNPQGQEQRKM